MSPFSLIGKQITDVKENSIRFNKIVYMYYLNL